MRSSQVDEPRGLDGRADGFARAVIDAWDARIVVLDRRARVVFVSPAWTRGASFDRQDAREGCDWLAVCDRAAMVEPALAGIADGVRGVLVGTTSEFVQTYPGSDAVDPRWYELTARPLTLSGGIGVAVMHEDITDRKGRDHVEAARSLPVDEFDAAVIATDLRGVISSWSKGAERLYGWRAPDAVGQLSDDLVGVSWKGDGPQFVPHVIDRDAWEGDGTAIRRDGSPVQVHVRAIVLRDAAGLRAGVVVVAVDRTERLAMDDQLRAISDSIGDGLCTLDGSGRVLYVNPQGRRMMRASLTESLGGSFHHWIHGLGDARPWETASTRPGSRPVACQLVRRDGTDISIEFVATALRTEKGMPVSLWVVVFRDISATRSREDALAVQVEEVACLGRIRHALDHDGFVLHAQPIVDLATRRPVHHELLLRMRDPDDPDVLLSPVTFLPTAEKLGVAPAIDRWVVSRAMELAAQGHAVDINISARSLENVALPHLVEQLLAESGADPADVVFEITETALLENDVTARYFADKVRSLGCGLALDDFGTGFGGFTYIKHFPLDYLKIDIEFVRDVVTDQASRHVVAAIVSMAAAFGLRTVAEGVEDEPTSDVLRDMGVDQAQGYLFGNPAPTTWMFEEATERTTDDRAHHEQRRNHRAAGGTRP